MNKQILIKNIKHIIKNVVKENLQMNNPEDAKLEIIRGLKTLYQSVKHEYELSLPEFANIVISQLIKYQDGNLNETKPAPAPAPNTPGAPVITPDKPKQRPGVRRPLTPPKTAPETKPKAKSISESEDNILNKIENRFKKLKNNAKK